MQASENCIWMIEDFEGFRADPYKCPAGVWTIGFGTTRNITKDTPKVTKDQAEALLLFDVATFEKGVSDIVKVPLSQHQFDALVSFSYNIGLGAFRTSTLVRRLNGGDYNVGAEFLRWNKASGKELPGLTRRREAEKQLFEKGKS